MNFEWNWTEATQSATAKIGNFSNRQKNGSVQLNAKQLHRPKSEKVTKEPKIQILVVGSIVQTNGVQQIFWAEKSNKELNKKRVEVYWVLKRDSSTTL